MEVPQFNIDSQECRGSLTVDFVSDLGILNFISIILKENSVTALQI